MIVIEYNKEIKLNREMVSNGTIMCNSNKHHIQFVINKLCVYIIYANAYINIQNGFNNELYCIYDDGSISSISIHNICRIYNTGDIVDSFVLLKELLLRDCYTFQYDIKFKAINWNYVT